MTLKLNYSKAKNTPPEKPGKYFDWDWNAERQEREGERISRTSTSQGDTFALELQPRSKDFNGGSRNLDGAERQFDYDEVIRLYTEERLNGKQIAKQLGANPATIYRILKIAGVTRRYNGGRNQYNAK